MNKKFISLIVIVFGVAIFLVIRGIQTSAASVITPQDLLSKPTDTSIERLKVAGRVVEEGYDYQVEPEIILKFSIVTPGRSHKAIPVIYKQLKPDMFNAGRDVIVEGSYVNGTFEAKTLLTQCPSKYEPPKPK